MALELIHAAVPTLDQINHILCEEGYEIVPVDEEQILETPWCAMNSQGGQALATAQNLWHVQNFTGRLILMGMGMNTASPVKTKTISFERKTVNDIIYIRAVAS